MRERPDGEGKASGTTPSKALLANLPVPVGEPDDYWEKNLEQNDKLGSSRRLRNVFIILTRDVAGRACWRSTSSRTRW
jgi:hypothetical protein